MRNLLYFIAVLSLFLADMSFAKTVFLEQGENYSNLVDNVVCVQNKRSSFEPVSISDCQYWDDFNQICLHEKTIMTTGDIECAKECQHWDDFYKKCLYETSCRFDRDNGLFIKTSCFNFDQYSKKCLQIEQEKIDIK